MQVFYNPELFLTPENKYLTLSTSAKRFDVSSARSSRSSVSVSGVVQSLYSIQGVSVTVCVSLQMLLI